MIQVNLQELLDAVRELEESREAKRKLNAVLESRLTTEIQKKMILNYKTFYIESFIAGVTLIARAFVALRVL